MEMVLEVNLLGALRILKEMKIKPNFSELERQFGVDRHTIKKYYDNDGKIIKERTKRVSKYAINKDEIIEVLENPAVTIQALYQYLVEKYHDPLIKYNGLKSYTLSLGIRRRGIKTTPHVRYETKPGDQLQVDWKEDIEMTSSLGEVFKFNIFTATLGFSRLHTFTYSKTRTTEDFLRCTIDTFNKIGGVPKNIKTDNMSAVVSITNGYKKKHSIIRQFEKDTDVKINLCKAHTPETKGKVESANRFLAWLLPYNNKFKDENELIEIIDKINKAVNNAINQTTNIPPITLFKKEKEYLNPLPSKILLETYISNVETQVMPPTLLVRYKGNGYSVPKSYIGKRVKIIPISNKLYMYCNTDLITTHEIALNKFNYHQQDYTEGLMDTIRNTDRNINEIAVENLKLLEKVGK